MAILHETYITMMMMIGTGIGITLIKTVGEEGTNLTMGIRNLNFLRNQVRKLGNIGLNQSLTYDDIWQTPHSEVSFFFCK